MLDFTQTLGPDQPLIHPTCVVKNCAFGSYVELGDHCIAEETAFGDYTYLFGSNDVIFATLGKFNSIATGVRINPVNHPMRERVAAHHLTYRAAHYGLGEDDPSIIQWRRYRDRKRRVDRPQRRDPGRRHPGGRRGGGGRGGSHPRRGPL